MTSQFRPLSTYKNLPAPSLPGLGAFDPTVAPKGSWVLADGTAARTGRSAEPLLNDRWSPVWRAPLGESSHPTAILVGGGLIVTQGPSGRRIWSGHGQALSQIPFRTRTALLDAKGPRLLTDGPEGGLYSYRLPKSSVECSIALSLPSDHLTAHLLPGPDDLLCVVTRKRSLGGHDDAVVELVKMTDWAHVRSGSLYGMEPVAGIIREADSFADAALANSGPVLATPDGIVWCDWQLGTLAEHHHALKPVVMSVDSASRVLLVGEDERLNLHFVLVPPGDAPLVDLPLPKAKGFDLQPPLILADGAAYLLQPGQLLSFDAAGAVRWHISCGSCPRGSLTSNGLLLLADAHLLAVDETGQATLLWTAPAPLTTPPVLAHGHIFVATADELFMLRGA